MKKIVATALLLFVASVALCQEILTGKVVRIADGDTFTILVKGNKQVKVRFHGIDCPESNQDFGTKAKQFTSSLAFSKVISVEVKDTDRYGRTIGIITLPDGRILNEELLKAGLAWHYKHFDKSERYAQLEREAKANRLGVWSMKNPVAPWEFRRSKR